MAHWSDDYLGLPWMEKGRDRKGVDCWGLCRLAYAEKRAILLQSFHHDYTNVLDRVAIQRAIDAEIEAMFAPVAEPDVLPWDFILLREGTRPVHVGLVVAPGRMLHIEADSTSRVQRWTDPEFRLRVVGFYRLIEA